MILYNVFSFSVASFLRFLYIKQSFVDPMLCSATITVHNFCFLRRKSVKVSIQGRQHFFPCPRIGVWFTVVRWDWWGSGRDRVSGDAMVTDLTGPSASYVLLTVRLLLSLAHRLTTTLLKKVLK